MAYRPGDVSGGEFPAAVIRIEMLAMSDLSLMVKAGVQWGLFGGAIANLGTRRHHDAYLRRVIDLDLPGGFAMTDTGHGSDVQSLETTATYDPSTEEFVIHSPTPSSRKDHIGGAAQNACFATVFAQLSTGGQVHGVHCFMVPIRDRDGSDLPGVTTSDCDYNGGLPGVDNGRIVFDQVRIPRVNLLNRYGDVAADGSYTSPIDNPNRRFFTMLGTLVRGRVTVAGSAAAAARVALDIAVRYSLQRKQFRAGADEPETPILDYLCTPPARTSTASCWRRSSPVSTPARTPDARRVLDMLCDLYALSVIEGDRAWFIEHRFLSTERAKAVTRGLNERCRTLRPYARDLVDGFGIPEQLRDAHMLHPTGAGLG